MTVTKSFLALLFSLTVAIANPFYSNILFNEGSDSLTTESQNKLRLLANEFDSTLLTNASEKLVLTGFTDQSGVESEDSLLSQRRSESIAQFIISEFQIPEDLIVIRGESQNRYHILTVTAEGRRQNRRVEMTIRKFTQRVQLMELTILESDNITASLSSQHSEAANDSTILEDSLSNEEITSSNNQRLILRESDTVFVEQFGYCRLAYGSTVIIDIDENSSITINDGKIELLSGKLQYHRNGNDERIPQFKSGSSSFTFTENGVVELTENSALLISVLSGDATVRSPYGTRSGSSMQGIAVEPELSKITVTDLPTAPSILASDTISLLSGLTYPIQWTRSGESYAFRVGTTMAFTEIVDDTIQVDTSFDLGLEPGTYYLQIQSLAEPGFKSLWTDPQIVIIEKKPTIISLTPFEDTLFVISQTRPFEIIGEVEAQTGLFIGDEEIQLDVNNQFNHSVMLDDDVTTFHFISQNPDSSLDTLETQVLYTGADERIFINDSILGRPAYTTTRYYNFRGSMPTATALSINGESVELDDEHSFENQFKISGFSEIPVEMEISFENGHTKTIERSIERIQGDTQAQRVFLTILGIAATSGLFVLIATQTGE